MLSLEPLVGQAIMFGFPLPRLINFSGQPTTLGNRKLNNPGIAVLF